MLLLVFIFIHTLRALTVLHVLRASIFSRTLRALIFLRALRVFTFLSASDFWRAFSFFCVKQPRTKKFLWKNWSGLFFVICFKDYSKQEYILHNMQYTS